MNVTQPISRMARAEPPPTRLNRAKPITHLTRVPTLISPFLSPPSPLYSRRTVAGKSKSFSTPQFTLYYLLRLISQHFRLFFRPIRCKRSTLFTDLVFLYYHHVLKVRISAKI